MVFQPAWKSPARPCQLSADHMTASQKGATSSLQSEVFMSCNRTHARQPHQAFTMRLVMPALQDLSSPTPAILQFSVVFLCGGGAAC